MAPSRFVVYALLALAFLAAVTLHFSMAGLLLITAFIWSEVTEGRTFNRLVREIENYANKRDEK